MVADRSGAISRMAGVGGTMQPVRSTVGIDTSKNLVAGAGAALAAGATPGSGQIYLLIAAARTLVTDTDTISPACIFEYLPTVKAA